MNEPINRLTEFAPTEMPGLSAADVDGAKTGRALPLPRAYVVSSSKTDLDDAHEKARACEEFIRLTRDGGMSLRQAAVTLRKPATFFAGRDSVLARYLSGGLAALTPERSLRTATAGDLTTRIEELGWFIPAAKQMWMYTNRTKHGGSVPEAIRRTISLPYLPNGWTKAYIRRLLRACGTEALPVCPADLREEILAREREGKPMVPERIAKQIQSSKALVEQHRRPHEADLNYLSAPGTMMTVRHRGPSPDTSHEYMDFARAGTILEADDGSINFPVCIPWVLGGNPCADKFKVIVGRFQWLRTIDVGTRYRPGWLFVARPRGSYRANDVLALLHGLCRQHGIWQQYRFERGVWKSDLVKNAIERLGSQLHTVFSPHSKPFIEGGFNHDWTKLSVQFPHCDLGRYRGDTEETNKVLQACRKGQQDPRQLFPMLKDVMAAFDAITAEQNASRVNSRNYGSWIPEERWNAQRAEGALRKFPVELDWTFSPFAMEWTVRGMLVGGKVPLFEDMSVPFDFGADWLYEFKGARVRCHFNPYLHKCHATIVLLQAWGNHKAGEVIGTAEQLNSVAGYARFVMGLGDDPDTAGLRVKQQAAAAMRRELRTILPNGGKGAAVSEEHDGIATTTSVETAGKVPVPTETAAPAPDRATRIRELEEFERNNQHLFL